MPLKLSVGVSRKVGQPAYGSIGAACGVELELESGLLRDAPEEFDDRVRSAYAACAAPSRPSWPGSPARRPRPLPGPTIAMKNGLRTRGRGRRRRDSSVPWAPSRGRGGFSPTTCLRSTASTPAPSRPPRRAG